MKLESVKHITLQFLTKTLFDSLKLDSCDTERSDKIRRRFR